MELKPLTEEERRAGIDRFAEHQDAGHQITINRQQLDSYMYMVATCATCDEEFIANCAEW